MTTLRILVSVKLSCPLTALPLFMPFAFTLIPAALAFSQLTLYLHLKRKLQEQQPAEIPLSAVSTTAHNREFRAAAAAFAFFIHS